MTGERPRRSVFFAVKPEEVGFRWETSDAGPLLVLDAWLGDDLLSAHPTFLVTGPLEEALGAFSDATGYRRRRVRVTRSSFLAQTRPTLALPPLWALDIDGTPGVDDVGLTPHGALVVSQRLLNVLVLHRVGRAIFTVHPGAGHLSAFSGAPATVSLRAPLSPSG